MNDWSGKDRRKTQDSWRLIARVLAIFGWVLFIVALIVSHYAAPDQDYGYMRYRNIDVRDSWLTPMTGYLYVILWLSSLFSFITILIDKFRGRRATDNIRFNAVLLLTITIAWSAYIVFHLSK